MKKILRYTLLLFLLLVGYFVSFLTYGTLTDWQPTEKQSLTAVSAAAKETVIQDSLLRLLIWNVGYGGLSSEVAFFYDQGDFLWTTPGNVRTADSLVEKAVNGQEAMIQSIPADFYLMQEVDTASRRSYYTNQLDSMAMQQPDYDAYFALNYKNERVPIPIFQFWDHYGYVRSGLLNLSRFKPQSSTRFSLPGDLEWPTRLFELDRCVLRQTFKTASGKDLIIYNAHLAAYDKGGVVKKQQMDWLRQQIIKDYEQGAYVIVGGDWNQVPPGFDYAKFSPDRSNEYSQIEIGFDYAPEGWLWAYDPDVPTNRKMNEVYDIKKSRKSLIDFYLLSPNLTMKKVKTINQEFTYSDHQAVYLEVELR